MFDPGKLSAIDVIRLLEKDTAPVSQHKVSAMDVLVHRNDINKLHKHAFFGSIAKAVLPFAAFSGVMSGIGQEGDIKEKMFKGMDSFTRNVMSPRKLMSNLVGFGGGGWIGGKLAPKGLSFVGNLAGGLGGAHVVDTATGVSDPRIKTEADNPLASKEEVELGLL